VDKGGAPKLEVVEVKPSEGERGIEIGEPDFKHPEDIYQCAFTRRLPPRCHASRNDRWEKPLVGAVPGRRDSTSTSPFIPDRQTAQEDNIAEPRGDRSSHNRE
jgi:hypothetical protein